MSDATALQWMILCEGSGDAAFFRHLIKERGLPNYNVTFPNERNEKAQGGVEGFKRRLDALVAENDRTPMMGILVVIDKDEDGDQAFNKACDAVSQAAGAFGIPTDPLSIATSGTGLPAVAVMLIPPDGDAGQLETLCLKAFGETRPDIKECADEFAKCSGADQWKRSKREKMMLRSMLAACCENDPNTSLTHAWSQGRPKMIDLQHSCFDGIAQFLREFPGKVMDLAREG